MALEQQPRAYLQAFREFAALDEIDLSPQHDEAGAVSSLFPEDPSEVLLADVLDIVVTPAPGAGATGWVIADPLPVPNVRVRPSHVATATIQELLCGPLFAFPAAPTPPEEPTEEPTRPTPSETGGQTDAGGPRVDPESVKIPRDRMITLRVTKPVDTASAQPAQFSVTTYASTDGWKTTDVDGVALDQPATTITLKLKTPIAAGLLVRLIARGTGPQPILGTDLVPLAGVVGGPPGSANDGYDFVIMLKRS
jgi:hypothetical protein